MTKLGVKFNSNEKCILHLQAATNNGKTAGQLIGAGFLQFTVLEFDNGLLGVAR